MSARDDRDLRERFAALREADRAGAPPFRPVVRGRVRRFGLVPIAALAAAVIVAIAVVKLAWRAPSPPADEAVAQAEALSSWTAPTDVWLTLSGLEIPSSIPSLSPSSVALPETTATTTDSGELR